MKNEPKEINLIVAPQAIVLQTKDRLGGELQSLTDTVVNKIAEKGIDFKLAKKNIEKCIGEVGQLFSDIKQKAVDGWEIETISLSLAISAEGSIGIATAGVEASIEVSFKPK